MGSDTFDRNQLRLAWGVVGSMAAWIFYYGILLPGSVDVPGTDTAFAAATGNTLVLVRRHTDYTTMLGFAYGERPLLMWFFTLLPIVLAAAWLYRGYHDRWAFLYG